MIYFNDICFEKQNPTYYANFDSIPERDDKVDSFYLELAAHGKGPRNQFKIIKKS